MFIMSDSQQTDVNAASSSDKEEPKQINLLDIPVTDENSALNVMVGFLGLAQKRGAFAINESSKLFECIKIFQDRARN